MSGSDLERLKGMIRGRGSLDDPAAVALDPEVRTVGLVTLQQVDRAIISELNLTQSLLVVWPQLALLVAMTAAMFAIAYVAFVRQEVRA